MGGKVIEGIQIMAMTWRRTAIALALAVMTASVTIAAARAQDPVVDPAAARSKTLIFGTADPEQP